MSIIKVGDKVEFTAGLLAGDPLLPRGAHTVTDVKRIPELVIGIDADPGAWWKPECFRRAVEEPQKMSDFKVGDVVETPRGCVGIVVGAPRRVGGREGLPVRVGSDGSGAPAVFWLDHGISLVSRPSEAKPKVDCNLSCVHLAFPSRESHARWHRDNDLKPPTAPTFKVGDRVRMKPGGSPTATGVIASRHLAGSPHEWSVQPMGMKSYYGFNSDELELLPPEPGKLPPPFPLDVKVGSIYDNAASYKPMTATAASVKDAHYQHELDAMRYMLQSTLGKRLYDQVVKPPPPPLPPSNGWMPAGTYMPLKVAPRAAALEPGEIRFIPYKRMNVPFGCEEKGPGIAKCLPAYERRFSSRTMAWDPMDDTFLEDA